MLELIGLFLLSLCVSFAATFGYIRVAQKFKIFDQQSARSLHVGSKLRGGGVGIWFACLSITGIFIVPQAEVVDEIIIVMVLATCCAAIGFLDDLLDLSVFSRIGLQAVVACVFCHFHVLPSLFWAFIGAIVIIASINLTNFMDGADGLVASQSSIIFSVIAIIFYVQHAEVDSQAASVIAGGSLGFLLWNWWPSRVFMGDVGSYFLGFLLGATIIHGVRGENAVIPTIIMTLPLYTDAFITICLRMLRGERFWVAHNQHLYQRYIRHGRTHSKVSIFLLVTSGGFAALAVLSLYFADRAPLILLIAVVAASGLWFMGNRRYRFEAKV